MPNTYPLPLRYAGDADTYAVRPTTRKPGIRPKPGITRAVEVLCVLECRCDQHGQPHGLPVGVVVTVAVDRLEPLQASDRTIPAVLAVLPVGAL